jgi:hypothetical protein
MNNLWISLVPPLLIAKLGPLSLVVIGYLVEKNFVGRITTFANTLAINLHVYAIQNPHWILVWYANIGLIFGLLALFSYGFKEALSRHFYALNWIYSSFVVGMVILLTQ